VSIIYERQQYIDDNISLYVFQKENCFRQKLMRNSKHTFYIQELLSGNLAIYEIKWQNIGEPYWPPMSINTPPKRLKNETHPYNMS